MDTLTAFAMGAAARSRGETRLRVFDWNKAARIIAERKPDVASAGLRGDMEWTGGAIWIGAIDDEPGTYLASIWATPILEINGEAIDCWVWADETPGWDAGTIWPDSARAIIAEAE
jgi:hypothetical protein